MFILCGRSADDGNRGGRGGGVTAGGVGARIRTLENQHSGINKIFKTFTNLLKVSTRGSDYDVCIFINIYVKDYLEGYIDGRLGVRHVASEWRLEHII